MSTPARPISRRTVAKGAAWSLPAVSIAAAAPSLAASTGEPQPLDCTWNGNVTATLEDTATTPGLSDDLWRFDYALGDPSAALPEVTWTITAYEVFSREDDEPGTLPEWGYGDADTANLFTLGPIVGGTLPAENDQQGGGLSTFTTTVTLNPLTAAQRAAMDLHNPDWSIVELNWPDRIGTFGRPRSRWMYKIQLTEVVLPGATVPCPVEGFLDGDTSDHLVEARWLRQQAGEPKWEYYDAADAGNMSTDTGAFGQNDPMKYLPFGTVPSTFNNTEDV